MKSIVLLVGFFIGVAVGGLFFVILPIDGSSSTMLPTQPSCTSTENSLIECQTLLIEEEGLVNKYYEQCDELEQEVPEGTVVCEDEGCWNNAKNNCIKNTIYKKEREATDPRYGDTRVESEYLLLGYFEDDAYDRKICKYVEDKKAIVKTSGLILWEGKKEYSNQDSPNSWNLIREYDVIDRG